VNFLAHLHVAHDTPDSLVGNAIADHIKGKAFNELPPTIQLGIRQHRAVDAFTDSHQHVQRSITRMSENWGWFSGIIIDVYYDHILAINWDRYSREPLREFTTRMNLTLQACQNHISDEYDQEFYRRFIREDRL
jgi:acyl carrier protein phosphodiesterase